MSCGAVRELGEAAMTLEFQRIDDEDGPRDAFTTIGTPYLCTLFGGLVTNSIEASSGPWIAVTPATVRAS